MRLRQEGWRDEQIGLGVTRCPADSDDEHVMTFVIADDDAEIMDGQALLRAAAGPDAVLTGEGTTTSYTLPNDWPPTAPEGFALPERRQPFHWPWKRKQSH